MSNGQKPLHLQLDADLYAEIRAKAAQEDTSMRAIVMRALKRAGFTVPPADLRDKRKQ